jgi:hypothetical protein
VAYSGTGGRVPRYVCRGDRGERGSSRCLTLGSLRIDRAVAESVLTAIQPAGIEAATRFQEQIRVDDGEKRKGLELALERARYEEKRARRQYDAVDPENRLVAGEWEARWNRALAQAAEAETKLAAVGTSATLLSTEQKQQLMALSEDWLALWNQPEAPVLLKKRILRTVLKEVIVNADGEVPAYRVRLHWEGGVHTELCVERNKSGQNRRHVGQPVVELVSELAKVCPDKPIAAILNRLGYKTGHELSWNASRVAGLRGYQEIEPFRKQEEWVTQEEAARALQVSNTVVKRLIREQVLPAKQVVKFAPWIIRKDALDLPAVVAQIEAVRRGAYRPPLIAIGQGKLPLE